MLSVELLYMLTCPECHSPVIAEEAHLYCANEDCRRRFPVRDRVPMMSDQHEEVVDEQQWLDVMWRNGEC